MEDDYESPSPDPPFETTYANLLSTYSSCRDTDHCCILTQVEDKYPSPAAEELPLPLIDLEKLNKGGEEEREACKEEIARACREWGFFQVINHGIPVGVLRTMREEQKKLMRMPFGLKRDNKLHDHHHDHHHHLKLSEGSYRWGTRTARRLDQLSWSEAFHVLMADILGGADEDFDCRSSTIGLSMKKFAVGAHELALKVAGILADEVKKKSGRWSAAGCDINNDHHVEEEYFVESCRPSSCYLRLNRYPACPKYPTIYGIVPHTDSDFLTVLHQDDRIGGLQLIKDSRWITVKPNPHALIINIGDLFQAWSNDLYKSVEHRVVTNVKEERFSTAYFLCPSNETVITSDVYTNFTYGEYRRQVARSVVNSGDKIGLPWFLP